MELIVGERKRLKDLGLDEKWLHERISEKPSILGIGDLSIVERERAQPTGGRIDFVMSDEEDIRYEVEVMLGQLNPDHIIRSIEYWDVERTRFRQMEHRAVIIAEEITSRFFNVLWLLNRAVPIIAIQLQAVQIQGKVLLTFTKVLDVSELTGVEEPPPPEPANREYWLRQSGAEALTLVDRLVNLVPQAERRITYNRYHIALSTSGYQFAWFNPRQNGWFVQLRVAAAERADWIDKLTQRRIQAGMMGGRDMKMRLTAKDLEGNEDIIRDLLLRCEQLSRE